MNSTNLHVYYLQRNLSGFKKYLDGTEQFEGSKGNGNGGKAGSSSGPRSWSLNSLSSAPKKPDPNVKDGLGRTVLHLVCSTVNDSKSHDFLSVLLNHPQIAVNVQDSESGWTPLHRAMWAGNLRAARDLLSRSDIDIGVKDYEGFSPFDVYNSTCEGTNPTEAAAGTDLYTWGSNRNYSLGAGDATDRALPERVNLLNQVQATAAADTSTERDNSVQPSYDSTKFDRVGVNDVVMAKFHTGVLTAERRGNLSLTGFGSNGRLGKSTHSQYALLPHSDLMNVNFTAIALGQDHTLAVTSGGYIMSWGQNRFSQLGYIIEAAADTVHKAFNNSSEEVQVQVQPKRIIGPLKKEFVVGVAASRLSSACWTSDSIWTWGTNSGHLGYDKATNPVQVLPRKVTGISQSVIDMAMTDYATACLVETKEVLVMHHDAVFKINFPTQRFPSDFIVYRPPQYVSRPTIDKITSCGNTVAAVSSLGDVFTFNLPNPVDIPDLKTWNVKPQMAWALRKRFTAVKDVALGSDSTIILCTHSGHVFVRQRQGKQVKVVRLPRLQRIIKVACNEVGSFAAIRSDATPGEFSVSGPTLNEDLLNLLPHMRRTVQSMFGQVENAYKRTDDDEDDGDSAVQHDIEIATRIAIIDQSWQTKDESATLGTDVWLVVGSRRVPAHKFILVHRLPKLASILKTRSVATTLQNVISVEINESREFEIHFSNMEFVTLILLLQYAYSDDIAALWDNRVLYRAQGQIPEFRPDVSLIKRQLIDWVEILDLEKLRGPLASTGKVAVAPTLKQTWQSFHKLSQDATKKASADCDTILRLSDRDLLVNSLLLRARCPTFDAMYEDTVWTTRRENEDGEGHVVIDMSHLRYRSFSLVMRFLHEGTEDLIDYSHQDTLDGLLDFVFETLAVANFLLLDRLVSVLSQVVRRHVATNNAASLATEAAFHNAVSLKNSIFHYIACNLETMLENGYLDDMNTQILNDLASFVQERQGMKLPVSRSGILTEMAVERQTDWLESLDLPQPKIRPPRIWKVRSPRVYPAVLPPPSKKGKGKTSERKIAIGSALDSRDQDDMFEMEEDIAPPVAVTTSQRKPAAGVLAGTPAVETLTKGTPWRSSAVDTAKKFDLRAIMAETETLLAGPSTPPTGAAGKYMPPSARKPSVGLPASASATPPRPSGVNPLSIGKESPGSWRTGSTAPTSASAVNGSSAFPTLGSSQRPSTAKTPSNNNVRSTTANRVDQAGPSRSDVIIPSRQATLARKGSEPAWATPVTYFSPPTSTIATSPGTSGAFSILEIQQHERDIQAHRNELKMAPKSLVEIQEQERKDEEAKVAELEFQRWWTQEEARIAAENSRNQPKAQGIAKRGAGTRHASDVGKDNRSKGKSKKPLEPEPSPVPKTTSKTATIKTPQPNDRQDHPAKSPAKPKTTNPPKASKPKESSANLANPPSSTLNPFAFGFVPTQTPKAPTSGSHLTK